MSEDSCSQFSGVSACITEHIILTVCTVQGAPALDWVISNTQRGCMVKSQMPWKIKKFCSKTLDLLNAYRK